MNDLKTLGRFAINANLDVLQDIFELEEAFDDIVGGLIGSPEVLPEVWDGLARARGYMDAIRTRTSIIPMALSEMAPNTHEPETVISE